MTIYGPFTKARGAEGLTMWVRWNRFGRGRGSEPPGAQMSVRCRRRNLPAVVERPRTFNEAAVQ